MPRSRRQAWFAAWSRWDVVCLAMEWYESRTPRYVCCSRRGILYSTPFGVRKQRTSPSGVLSRCLRSHFLMKDPLNLSKKADLIAFTIMSLVVRASSTVPKRCSIRSRLRALCATSIRWMSSAYVVVLACSHSCVTREASAPARPSPQQFHYRTS